MKLDNFTFYIYNYYIFILSILAMQTSILPEAPSCDINCYYNQQRIFSEKKDWNRAESLLRNAIRKYPDELYFHTLLNDSLRNQKKNMEALKQIEPLYKKFPENKNIQNCYLWSLQGAGWELNDKKQYDKTLEMFQKAYAVNPEEEWTLNGYGSSLRVVGRLDESIVILEKGYKLYPKNPYIPGNLAYAYLYKGISLSDANRLNEAEPYFDRAGKITPEEQTYLLYYAFFLNKKKNYVDSMKTLLKGQKLYPENKNFAQNGRWILSDYVSSVQDGDVEKAIKFFESQFADLPENAMYSYYMSALYLRANDYDKSFAEIIKVMDLYKRKSEQLIPKKDMESMLYDQTNAVMKKLFRESNFEKCHKYLTAVKNKNFFNRKYFILQMEASVIFTESIILYEGKNKNWVDLSYRAYDEYIREHPEHRVSINVANPLKGIYVTGGNSRRDTITHSGFNQFCYDFFGADEAGKLMKKRNNQEDAANDDYIGFGAKIYSTVDGVVESSIDEYADLPPTGGPYYLKDGNAIIIKDERGYHHGFAHVKHLSAKVKKGDTVKAGQEIAELGNTGMTWWPHLHYCVHSPDWMVSIQSKFQEFDIFADGKKIRNMKNSVPLDKQVVEFK